MKWLFPAVKCFWMRLIIPVRLCKESSSPLIHVECFRVIRVASLLLMLTITNIYEYITATYTEVKAVVAHEVAQDKVTSVTYMIILGVSSCSKPPSMRPISRLTDCQVGWLWTVETAVKIAPLPLTLCSLQETNFCGCVTEIVNFFVSACRLRFVWVKQFVHFSNWQRGQEPAGRPIHTIQRVSCGWTAHGLTVLCLLWERQAAC